MYVVSSDRPFLMLERVLQIVICKLLPRKTFNRFLFIHTIKPDRLLRQMFEIYL